MPKKVDETGSWFENCKKSDQFKESSPGEFKTSLQKLAELQDLRLRIKALRESEAELCREIYDLLPDKEMDVGGIGQVTKAMGSSKKWDHENLWYTVTARALDKKKHKIDTETGEILVRETDHGAVMRVLRECAYVSYWKLGALEEYGIDADEYCEVSWTKPSIRIKT
jgi:hypothetical protein